MSHELRRLELTEARRSRRAAIVDALAHAAAIRCWVEIARDGASVAQETVWAYATMLVEARRRARFWATQIAGGAS